MNIDIVGAGIGGLTTALALEQKGFQPTIYEQAEILKPLGAGIILASNAMKVFKSLGIDEQLKFVGIPLKTLNITKPDLKVLSQIDLTYFKNKYDLQSIVIHRGTLQRILLENLKRTKIYLDHKLMNATKKNDGYELVFNSGRSVKSNLILAADGIHSRLRQAIVPNSAIRSMNQVCWRGVTAYRLPSKYQSTLNEAWGRGSRFAFVQCDRDQIYWYAVKSFRKDKNELSKKELRHYFRQYAPIVSNIIDKTSIDTVHTTVIEDLKPIDTWYDEYLCLIGDAAHAATPNMGQGACQSIEDAYTIAKYLALDTQTAFAQYQKSRISNANKVVKQSWQIGKISHWVNPIGVFLRDNFLRMTPKRLNQIQLETLFEL